jgi:hypothetical protein
VTKAYRVVNGLNYPPNGKGDEVRAEPGDVVTDLPPKSVAYLLEQGDIEVARTVVGEARPELLVAGQDGMGAVIHRAPPSARDGE